METNFPSKHNILTIIGSSGKKTATESSEACFICSVSSRPESEAQIITSSSSLDLGYVKSLFSYRNATGLL